MEEHRCKPGRRSVDRRCTWHQKHYWCEFCEGYYGVPHDYGCHTREILTTGKTHSKDAKCACRFCQECHLHGTNETYYKYETQFLEELIQ